MSIMEYDIAHRFLPHSLSYAGYYCERNAPLELSHTTRANPRGYPLGGPVVGMHSRANMGREDGPMETGPARRRIAVACARCRKRKIRCSGDPGNGSGCTNCRQAGIDAAVCQFHRVGSDSVQKVIDNINMTQSMASANGLMPIYSANNPPYPRPISAPQYPQLDTKSMCPSAWNMPYSEDTSPVDTYSLDQPTTHLSNQTPTSNTNMYPLPYRWTQPVAKPQHQGSNFYIDQGSTYSAHSLPYIQTSLPSATTEAVSPLNMSSMQASLPPGKAFSRKFQAPEATPPRRQLPIPQPSSAQPSRNAVDQLQDQRLRSNQMRTGGSFTRSLLPWSPDGNTQVNVADAMPSNTNVSSTEGAMGYLPTTTTTTTTSITDDITTREPPQVQLNFSTSTLLEALNASAPATTYSNFREYRPPASTASQMVRQSSQTNLYSFITDHASKRNSLAGESPNDCTLVSGHRYTPLGRSQPQSATVADNLHRESFEDRNVSLHRASVSNVPDSF